MNEDKRPNESERDEQRQPADKPCPICGKPASAESTTFPFCSDRCRQIDLGKWISGDYTISRPIEQSDLDET